ncbi:ABC transporter C family member 2 isoform A [Micractinium conductrix]|uniref:ABC transporter C family member 2 isoform A n=1 Tax=Micractinium conductrix TaxID=554055 RepID=A0A2P6VHH5_9CHLO|nr:ABC transporter C family member 2 isoform A [Micractinium conductrix]|eukprot:PSC73528.1 ABC transporter C family member 2 isoform A [Micractinium conductrix]
MKFGKYLLEQQRPGWEAQYLDYKGLKDEIKAAAEDARKLDDPALSYSPRTTSLTVQRRAAQRDSAEERFFRKLEAEVHKINRFTQAQTRSVEQRLQKLQDRAALAEGAREKEGLLAEAKKIGDEFLALEKYVNLNYMGFHKILKKHDKMLPHTPCRQFYISHLHNQPWVQGNYSELMVILSGVFSQLRGDQLAEAQGGSAQAFNRSTTKYWVRTSDVSTVKRIIIENMPVFVFNKENYSGDAQLVNSVYFDNDSLELYHGRLDKKPGAIALRVRWYGPGEPRLCFIERKTHRESWKGEKSVKERFTLPEPKVVPYLEGEYTAEHFREDLRAKGKAEDDIAKAAKLFEEISQQIDAKQLKPFIRTQYMRSAFQMGHDRTVSFTLDTNLCMIKENPEGHPSCAIAGRWYRDPSLPIHRTEITRFPHAVLEIKLALPEGALPPEWVRELMDSGLVTEVHKSSKFIHGTAVLFPDMVQAVPYWIDDESIRASILASAADPRPMSANARDAVAISLQDNKPRRRLAAEPRHPLLGNAPSLRLMRANTMGGPVAPQGHQGGLLGLLGLGAPNDSVPQRLEPKTFLASERTFLSWMHMAITLGSIAAALLAFAASSKKSKSPMHTVSAYMVEIIALVLLPLAVLIVAYSLLVFVWRNSQIAMKQASYIDDRRGPLLLAGMVISALTAIFLVSCVDLWDAWAGSHSAGGGGGGGPNGLWEGLTGLANSSSSLSTPASVLPQALGLPLAHLGGTA